MQYLLGNFAKNTTTAPAKQQAGTLKTMLQFKPLRPCRIVEWGYSFDGSSPATPGIVELVEVDVAATVTALAAADITPYDAEALGFNSGDPTSDYISVGTSATGFQASGEGTPTVARNLAGPQLIAPTNEIIYQSPWGFRAYCQAAKFTRIRMSFVANVNCLMYLIVEF
jgi:hypothetical protein